MNFVGSSTTKKTIHIFLAKCNKNFAFLEKYFPFFSALFLTKLKIYLLFSVYMLLMAGDGHLQMPLSFNFIRDYAIKNPMSF